jgi:hypothetical protein
MFQVAPDRIDTPFILAQVNRLGLQAEWDALKDQHE